MQKLRDHAACRNVQYAMYLRSHILKLLYHVSPFSLKGDAIVSALSGECDISCIITFYGRLDLLEGILFSLAEQDLPRTQFEVILVEDRGGTEQGRALAARFGRLLPVRYCPLPRNYGKMGYARNYGLEMSSGKYVLMLDDDTVLLQKSFLRNLLNIYESDQQYDAIIPRGEASYALIKGRYDYHERFFMTNRCLACRRSVLAELGGYMSDFIGQEDVEFIIRFLMAGKKSFCAEDLRYSHPPLMISSLSKPMAVGLSFYGLRRRYPFLVWLLAVLNGSRHLPFALVPLRKYQEMGRFGRGFFLGLLAGCMGKTNAKYT